MANYSKEARYVAIDLPLPGGIVRVYASPKIKSALDEVTADMNIYKGVRLKEVIEAAYKQGKKDGAAEALEQIEINIQRAKDAIPHRNPGKPKKEA